jgi:hypothetical protein
VCQSPAGDRPVDRKSFFKHHKKRGLKMPTALRKIIDADAIARIFSIPPHFAGRRLEVTIRPLEEEPSAEPDISRFLSGKVDWSKATAEELVAGYRAMAADEEYEQEAQEWVNGYLGKLDEER